MLDKTDIRAFEQHDHNRCIDIALETAHELCRKKRLRLTPIREQVFTLICQSHKPLGAYAILDLLTEANKIKSPNKAYRLAPPTVYRALEFLQENGFIHKITTLNAFISCCHPARSHQSHFLICRQCDSTVEFASQHIIQAIEDSASEAQFLADSACVEIIGLCPACQIHKENQ